MKFRRQSANGSSYWVQRVNYGNQARSHIQKNRASRDALIRAFHNQVPANKWEKDAFNALFPEIYAIRGKGFSFQQITSLLHKLGFTMDRYAVRLYYMKNLVGIMALVDVKIKAQMLLLEQLKSGHH